MYQTPLLWVLVITLVVVAAVSIATALQHRRHGRLAARFGPEYERVIDLTDSRHDTESALQSRVEHREHLHVSPLTAEEASAFVHRWRDVQAEFVDSPPSTIGDAQALVDDVMRVRGYPVDDFEANADLVSVDHPVVVEHYRAAHATYLASRLRRVTTEELRQAIIHYRVLLADLLELDTSRP